MQRNLEYIIFWNSFRKLIWDDTSCDSECKYISPQATNKKSLCEIIQELEVRNRRLMALCQPLTYTYCSAASVISELQVGASTL